MKRLLPLVIVTILAGAVAFGVTQWLRHHTCPDEDTWLKTEFSLSEPQLAAIRKIRADYQPLCADHCSKLGGAKQKVTSAEKTSGPASPEAAAARAELATLSHECERTTRHHLESIAAEMPPEEGRRYLEMVSPKITSASVKSNDPK